MHQIIHFDYFLRGSNLLYPLVLPYAHQPRESQGIALSFLETAGMRWRKRNIIKSYFNNIFKLFIIAFCLYYVSLFVKADSLILNSGIKVVLVLFLPVLCIFWRVFSQQEMHRLKDVLNNLAEKYIFLKKPLGIVNNLIK